MESRSSGFDPSALLLPYQVRWIADKSRLKIADKSRRIGITWATALEGVLEACASRGAGGQDVWYSVNNEDDAREFVDDSSDWASALNVAAGDVQECLIEDEGRDIQAFRIRYASGYKLTALSSNPRRLRGKEGYAICDEAAHHDSFGEFLKAARAYVIWGTGRLAVISTHNGSDSGFNQLIEEVRAERAGGQFGGRVHRVTIDDALAEGLYRRICQKLRQPWSPETQARFRQELVDFYGDDSDEELLCVPRGTGGRYLSRKIIEQCQDPTAPVLRLSLRDEFATRPEVERVDHVCSWLESDVRPHLDRVPMWAEPYFGADFGRVSDLTVLAPMYLDEGMRRVCPFLLELRNVPFDQQRQVIWYVMDHYDRRDKAPGIGGGVFDAAGIGADISEAARARYGREVLAIHLAGGPPRDDGDRTAADGDHKPSLRYSEALPPLKAHLEDRGVSIPKHVDVTRDLELIERKDGHPYLPPRRVQGSDRSYRHGDAAIAITLAHYASLEAGRGSVIPAVRRHLRRVRL